MRWTHRVVENKEPKVGDTRIVKHFPLFPRRLPRLVKSDFEPVIEETVWLEDCLIVQQYEKRQFPWGPEFDYAWVTKSWAW